MREKDEACRVNVVSTEHFSGSAAFSLESQQSVRALCAPALAPVDNFPIEKLTGVENSGDLTTTTTTSTTGRSPGNQPAGEISCPI